jgi:hypothetical protein
MIRGVRPQYYHDQSIQPKTAVHLELSPGTVRNYLHDGAGGRHILATTPSLTTQ